MQKRNVLNSPRLLELKKRRRRVFLNKIFLLVLGGIVVSSLFVYLSHLNSLNISNIEILGNKILDTETLKASVNQGIVGKYLWLFPKTNILIYPQNAIKKELQSKFKRLKSIDLLVRDNQILEVTVSEREAKYMWCGVTPPVIIQNINDQECYFVDENGYLFDEAPYFSGEVYFKLYGTIDIPPGTYFFEQNFKQLVSFKEMLVDMGLKPVALYVLEDNTAEIFLSKNSKFTTEPKIIFRTNADFQNIAENLNAALRTEPLQTKFKNKYSSLQYIDLRFENKVYDKFQ